MGGWTRRSCALALGLLLAACVGTAGAATATITYTATGSERTFVVPAGITRLEIVVTGGHGGVRAGGAATPGRAARIAGTLSVHPGQTLYVNVGGAGGAGATDGAFNGGGPVSVSSGFSGQGGGASDIRTVSRAYGAQSLASRLLVAGGGGGAGYGSNGGDAGLEGAAAQAGQTLTGGGGGGGTPSAGGSGGARIGCSFSTDGGDGSLGSGGYVGDFHGGSGGGGLYGGGGGGGWAVGCGGDAPAGGGGGGSSYIAPGEATGTIALAALADAPTVEIAYATPEVEATPATSDFGQQAVGTVGASRAVTIENVGDAPLHVSGLTFGGTDEDDFLLGAHDCGGAIAVGASCTVRVRFAPQAVGARSATLLIASDASVTPVAVALTGEGVDGPAGPRGPAGATGATGATGPQGATGPRPRGRSAAALRCVRIGRGADARAFRCTVIGVRVARRGARVRLTRGGRTVAVGVVAARGRVVLHARDTWRSGRGTLVLDGVRRIAVRVG